MLPQTPKDMVSSFASIGHELGDPPELVEILTKSLSPELLKVEVGQDKMTGLLRYEYGNPLTNVAGRRVWGTHQLPEPWQLYVAVRAANRYLGRSDLAEYLSRLKDINKHSDALLEMRPVGHLPPNAKVDYEVPGRKNRRIDWRVRIGFVKVVFDVKNRVKGAINHFADIVAELEKGNRSPPVPKTDPEAFFRSTEIKFRQNFSPLILQGVWTHVHIKESSAVLEQYFRKNVNRFRIDFLIIAGWTDECYILARSSRQKDLIKRLFGLKETMNFVF